MRRYTIKGGKSFTRNVHLAQNSWSCHGCPVTILKGEFYIKDVLSQPNNKYPRFPNRGTAMEDLIVIAWHMACAPLTRNSAEQILRTALKENTRDNPTRLEEANNV